MPQYHKSYRVRREIAIAEREKKSAQSYARKVVKENDLLRNVTNQRELLISVLKTVKGVTIPETDEGIEYLVDKYSNL